MIVSVFKYSLQVGINAESRITEIHMLACHEYFVELASVVQYGFLFIGPVKFLYFNFTKSRRAVRWCGEKTTTPYRFNHQRFNREGNNVVYRAITFYGIV